MWAPNIERHLEIQKKKCLICWNGSYIMTYKTWGSLLVWGGTLEKSLLLCLKIVTCIVVLRGLWNQDGAQMPGLQFQFFILLSELQKLTWKFCNLVYSSIKRGISSSSSPPDLINLFWVFSNHNKAFRMVSDL